MFCVKCGTKLEEQWKVCPNCGTKNIMKTEEIVDECIKPEVRDVSHEMDKNEEEKTIRQIQFEGFRRTNRFSFKYYPSEVEIIGNKIKTVVHQKKDLETTFFKEDISDIKFPYLPVLRGLDIFLILLFIVLTFFTKGLAVFAALFFAKISMVKHMQIKLKDGSKIAIPIRQAAETVEFLEVIDYPRNIIEKIASSTVSSKTIMIREWIVSGIMLVIAVITIGIASKQMRLEQLNVSTDKQDEEQSNIVEKKEDTEFKDEGEQDDLTQNDNIASSEIDYLELYSKEINKIVSEVTNRLDSSAAEALDYAFYDIDKDGYLELIMDNGTCNADWKIEVFTTTDGKNVHKIGESYGIVGLYEYPNENGLITDYAHMDYETVTLLSIKEGQLIEEELYHAYTLEYGYINGKPIAELAYPIEMYSVEDLLFQGVSGTYYGEGDNEWGAIEIYVRDNQYVDIRIGTWESPILLGGTGVIVDKQTVTMTWNGNTVFTLKWMRDNEFTIRRSQSCGIVEVDQCTDNVYYVDSELYYDSLEM